MLTLLEKSAGEGIKRVRDEVKHPHHGIEGDVLNQQFAPLFDRIAALAGKELSEQEIHNELERLGLVDKFEETPICQLLTTVEWMHLLRGMARCAPHFVFKLVKLRHSEGKAHGTIVNKLPRSDLSIAELAQITSGCLWHTWEICLQHAETRPMFRRYLADFPAIRLRLLRVLMDVLRADEWATLLATTQSLRMRMRANAALHRLADSIRIETQLICGGTGYMRESHYASALLALKRIDELLRDLPMSSATVFPPLQKKIELVVSARLENVNLQLAVLQSLSKERLK